MPASIWLILKRRLFSDEKGVFMGSIGFMIRFDFWSKHEKSYKPSIYAGLQDIKRTGDERIELPPKVLETPIIPFDQSPMSVPVVIIHTTGAFVKKRRWRDLNSRAGCPAYRISSADPSATWVHLRTNQILLYLLHRKRSILFE